MKSQHVAPGIFYYKVWDVFFFFFQNTDVFHEFCCKVPQNAENSSWLQLRRKVKEMVYGLEEQEPSCGYIICRTQHDRNNVTVKHLKISEV